MTNKAKISAVITGLVIIYATYMKVVKGVDVDTQNLINALNVILSLVGV